MKKSSKYLLGLILGVTVIISYLGYIWIYPTDNNKSIIPMNEINLSDYNINETSYSHEDFLNMYQVLFEGFCLNYKIFVEPIPNPYYYVLSELRLSKTIEDLEVEIWPENMFFPEKCDAKFVYSAVDDFLKTNKITDSRRYIIISIPRFINSTLVQIYVDYYGSSWGNYGMVHTLTRNEDNAWILLDSEGIWAD